MNEGTEFASTFTRDVIYWGKPQQSVLVMNLALFGSIIVYISLKFMPLRLIAVVILWLSVLQSSEFFSTLGKTTLQRVNKIDFVSKRKQVRGWLGEKR